MKLPHLPKTKLNQGGFDHVFVPIFIIVIVAVVGTAYMVMSRAASPTYYNLKLKLDTAFCIDNYGNSSGNTYAYMWSCGNYQAEQWTLIGSGNAFHIQDPKGTCLDDWYGGVGTGPSNRTYLHVFPCNGDHNQTWGWQRGQLENTYTHGCINDPAGAKSNTALIVFACDNNPSSAVPANAYWYQALAPGSSSGAGGGGSTSVSAIINAAAKYTGVPYVYGGGPHGPNELSAFLSKCTPSALAAKSVNCGTDCSGFVSVAIDLVYGVNLGWTVDANNGLMDGGSGTGYWQAVSMSKLQPGDIVTRPDHVEFFVSYGANGSLNTFGAHETGTTIGEVNAGAGYYTQAFQFK